VPGGACHDVPGFISQKNAETPAVVDTSLAGIELVQSVLEKLDVGGGRFFDLEVRHLVPIVCLTDRASAAATRPFGTYATFPGTAVSAAAYAC
jgi:hypothetical protein